MELGILSSFLSFLPFLLAAGESVVAVAVELPLVPSGVTEGDGRKGPFSPTGRGLIVKSWIIWWLNSNLKQCYILGKQCI